LLDEVLPLATADEFVADEFVADEFVADEFVADEFVAAIASCQSLMANLFLFKAFNLKYSLFLLSISCCVLLTR
jgi:hypothetical protein